MSINERVAQLTAHRACCGAEHDPQRGKLHGCCVVCGVPWPCAYAGVPPSNADVFPAIEDVLAKHCRGFIDRPTTRENIAELIDKMCETYAREVQVRQIERAAYERLALCSDHRDKATGRCIVCQAEERTQEEMWANGRNP